MHDHNFKNLILDYPRQALEFFAAAEVSHSFRAARIIPVRQEQLKNRLGDRFRELDTPLLVEWPDGRKQAILFVVEEESQHRRFSIHRLAHYCLDLSELMQTNRVVPVVIFLDRGQRQQQLVLGSEQHSYLQFSYIACELNDLQAKHYYQSDNIVARINLPNMHYPEDDKLNVYAAAQKGLVELEPHPEKQIKYAEFIDYYAELTDDEIEQYQETYLNQEEILMGLIQTTREQSLQQGMQQGLQQGKRQGEAALLLRLLEKRFGAIPESVQQQIQQADTETLLQWSERLLSSHSLDDIFA